MQTIFKDPNDSIILKLKSIILGVLPCFTVLTYEPRHEKTNVLVSNLVRHKPGCTATEDGYRLEISDLERREIFYLCSENKGADQLRGNREADLRFCFSICKMLLFS